MIKTKTGSGQAFGLVVDANEDAYGPALAPAPS